MTPQKSNDVQSGRCGFSVFQSSLLIDTWVRPGIYSSRLGFGPFLSGLAGIPSGAERVRDLRSMGYFLRGSSKRSRDRFHRAWKLQASLRDAQSRLASLGEGLNFNLFRAGEAGSPRLQSMRTPRLEPDLGNLSRKRRTHAGGPYENSDTTFYGRCVTEMISLRSGGDNDARQSE